MGTIDMNDLTNRRVELKFAIDACQSQAIRQWAREHMARDENVRDVVTDEYRITSLYLDTKTLDIFHRTPQCTKQKHRLRRYGNESQIWLETKRKSGDVVNKLRSSLTEQDLSTAFLQDLANLSSRATDSITGTRDGLKGHSTPTFAWFVERVQRHQLEPATYVAYERFARIATISDDTLRLTIDRNIRGAAAKVWQLPQTIDELDAKRLCAEEILELKFSNVLPPLFKKLMLEFQLTRSGLSKYRTSVVSSRHDIMFGLVA